jgi:general secretion pathway protein A
VYKNFFGLSRDPFEISPDPYFLFPTPAHNEALASLYYGVRRRKGFVVMTGEVGTGKTLLVRCLLDMLSRSNVVFAYVFNPSLSASNFLDFVSGEFGLPCSNKSKTDVIRQLNQFLTSRYQRRLTTTLIIDEAQHLGRDVLEEVRLLTNLETAQQKLLQIVLVGQAELEQKLDSPDLRQLKQRIALWCRLDTLSQQQTSEYMDRRLTLAGAGAHVKTIFPGDVGLAVHHYSRGIPRLINTICDNALIAAYARQSKSVTAEMVHQVADDLRLWSSLRPEAIPSNGHNNGQNEGVTSAAKSLLKLLESLANGKEPAKNHAQAYQEV